MLDRIALKILERPLQGSAAWLDVCGIKADHVTIAGFAVGVSTIPLLANQCYFAALATILLNRLADGLDGPLARRSTPTDSGAFLDIVLDFLFYGGVVLGFALADPVRNSLAAAWLLFSFIATASSFLAFSIMAERRGIPNLRLPDKGFYYLGGLTEGTETIFFFILFCLLPDSFPLLAYIFAGCCLFTATMRILYAYQVLWIPVNRVSTMTNDPVASVAHEPVQYREKRGCTKDSR